MYWSYFDNENEDDKNIRNIKYVESLYAAQKEKVKNEQYIENLLLRDYVMAIRKNLTKYDYVTIFGDAQKEVGEKLKKNRKNFETLKSFIISDFLNNDKNFNITGIISCGYETYAWAIELEGYGKSFRIEIPIKSNLTTENIDYARRGMFSFVIKTGSCSYSEIKSSYKINEIATAIAEYFEQNKSE